MNVEERFEERLTRILRAEAFRSRPALTVEDVLGRARERRSAARARFASLVAVLFVAGGALGAFAARGQLPEAVVAPTREPLPVGTFITPRATSGYPCLGVELAQGNGTASREVAVFWWDQGPSGDCATRASDVIRTTGLLVDGGQDGYELTLVIRRHDGNSEPFSAWLRVEDGALVGDRGAPGPNVAFVRAAAIEPTYAPQPTPSVLETATSPMPQVHRCTSLPDTMCEEAIAHVLAAEPTMRESRVVVAGPQSADGPVDADGNVALIIAFASSGRGEAASPAIWDVTKTPQATRWLAYYWRNQTLPAHFVTDMERFGLTP